mmetsp:Transcript_48370/g.90596  ORF Transcript_48370/g.90596 Transcript_48370/m.90596 type:complete len:114 (-) Transcript_48370:59-400(-)
MKPQLGMWAVFGSEEFAKWAKVAPKEDPHFMGWNQASAAWHRWSSAFQEHKPPRQDAAGNDPQDLDGLFNDRDLCLCTRALPGSATGLHWCIWSSTCSVAPPTSSSSVNRNAA